MKRNKFSLSHYKLTTCDMGQLVPIGCFEVLPGDSVQQATSALIRVSPLIAPVMHPVHVRIHHWFVPTRLIWDNFEKFITGGPDGNDATVPPYIEFGFTPGSLADYLGVPDCSAAAYQKASALPFRAYYAIYNDYYRDQDLQAERVFSKGDGHDQTTDINMCSVNWEKDYFTSARPWTQKGDEVVLPLGTMAPVESSAGPISFQNAIDGEKGLSGIVGTGGIGALSNWTSGSSLKFGAQTGLLTNLSTATAATVNQLREAFALQNYAEARAKYGSRYTEYLRYLGIRSSDSRQMRPEYLGGGKQTIQFSEVLQTGPDYNANANVGSMKGHGIGAMRTNRYRRFFEEHGFVMTLLSVKPKTMYCQGMPRMFSRQTKEEYFQRELQHIGQQEIPNKEIYVNHQSPEGVFGYQDRYDEYRRLESTVHGDFKGTLDEWHMARIFGSEPALNDEFVEAVPTKRVHQVTSEHVLWIMANHSIQARRMIAKRG